MTCILQNALYSGLHFWGILNMSVRSNKHDCYACDDKMNESSGSITQKGDCQHTLCQSVLVSVLVLFFLLILFIYLFKFI